MKEIKQQKSSMLDQLKDQTTVKNKIMPKEPKYYSVTKGETFADIEKKFNLQKGSLKKLNPNIDLDKVPNGKIIQIEG